MLNNALKPIKRKRAPTPLRLVHFALWATLTCQNTYAINKCTDATGKIAFQDKPCASSQQAQAVNLHGSTAIGKTTLFIPNERWGLSFKAPKLKKTREASQNGFYQYEAFSKSGFVLSLFVEPSEGKRNTKLACSDYYWKQTARNPLILKKTTSAFETEDFTIVSYLVRFESQGQPMYQTNYNIYGHQQNKCLDVHISKTFDDKEKIELSQLTEFSKSLRYEQKK